jgi:hypothetical protein
MTMPRPGDTKGERVVILPVTFQPGDAPTGLAARVVVPTRWEGDEQWVGVEYPGHPGTYAVEPWRVKPWNQNQPFPFDDGDDW